MVYVCTQKKHPLFVFFSTLLKSIALEETTLPDYVIVDYAIFTACRLIPEVEKDMANIKSIPCIYKNALADWMNLPYNESDYRKLIKNDFVFKLSFRTHWESTTSDGNKTFYGKFIHDEVDL